ncbi:TetR/AcrR family transcriptional regulator [Nocardioides stalactiti]|uniref:TetR/AcrR family transcriptional regulator n=1 Tax=Nocardioides stalactiti TaxID=2755356 RepID=UPI00160132D8|nr:TetR/AcrR family transcriptional regulator [Nocardioides stalactiti]
MTTPRGAGRPRDPRIEQAALDAARDLLVEVGYQRLTMAAVAGRAGTTKAALYRRWPSLPHLVYEAAFPDELLKDWHLGRELRADLLGIVVGTRDAFTSPVAAAALPGLLAEFSTHPALHNALFSRFAGVAEAIDDRFRAAAEAGEARPTASAQDVLNLMIGAALIGVLVGPETLDDAWAGRITDILTDGIRP